MSRERKSSKERKSSRKTPSRGLTKDVGFISLQTLPLDVQLPTQPLRSNSPTIRQSHRKSLSRKSNQSPQLNLSLFRKKEESEKEKEKEKEKDKENRLSQTYLPNSFNYITKIPQPSQLPHPFNDLLQPNKEEMLVNHFFDDPKFLDAYCKSFITGKENSSYNCRMLLKFFKSRGKLHELLRRVYTTEIETTSVHNPLFRGNTLFTKLYNEYTKTYCKEYMNNIMQPVLSFLEKYKSIDKQNQMKEVNKTNPLNIVILQNETNENRNENDQQQKQVEISPNEKENQTENEKEKQNENENEPKNEMTEEMLYKKTLQIFTQQLQTHLPPPTLLILLHGLYEKVYVDRNESIACNIIQTLLFLRFLLTPLSFHGQILRKLQMLLKKSVGQKPLNSLQAKRLMDEEKEFLTAVSVTYSIIFNCPYGEQSLIKGYNQDEQEETYHGILAIIRTNLNGFYGNYGEGFEEVFKITKNTKEQPKGNILLTSEEMICRMIEKCTELEEENKRLKSVISSTTEDCEKLKKKIALIQQFLNQSSNNE